MNSFALFTDVSMNPQTKSGVGAYLLVPESYLEIAPHDVDRAEISARLRFMRFTDTSSTKLEIQTVLWALENFRAEVKGFDSVRLRVFTDSQCVAGLPARRAGLEAGHFLARRSGQSLKNAPLYRAFFEASDELGFEVIKVAGHSRVNSRDTVQQIFSCIDKEVRRMLSRGNLLSRSL